jgi:hypothetical protein
MDHHKCDEVAAILKLVEDDHGAYGTRTPAPVGFQTPDCGHGTGCQAGR